jgi:hypothetical protein
MRPALEAGLRVQPEAADPYMRQVLVTFPSCPQSAANLQITHFAEHRHAHLV